ncbi:uncharacterized protein LOC127276960 [Leptopilina boulardi]|uniref:uncharacterized protein LOC127276960 n=1 Tax=Leptopilina boulardi TaxID=63433 RepID=UPI0021F50CD8|nr:uncharacterized protein LOC127276960 [Leptopilina boulardi]
MLKVAGNLRDCFLTKIKDKELLSALNIQNIWVAIDRTRLQQDQIKSLKTELHACQQAGEENLKHLFFARQMALLTHLKCIIRTSEDCEPSYICCTNLSPLCQLICIFSRRHGSMTISTLGNLDLTTL